MTAHVSPRRRLIARLIAGAVAVVLAWAIVATAFAARLTIAQRPAAAYLVWRSTPHAATRLGERALAAGRTPDATAFAAEALARDPRDSRALWLASTLAFDKGDRALADRIMILAARLGWRDPLIQRWVLERALFDNDAPAAARAADALMRSDGDAGAGRAGLARLAETAAGRDAIADRMAFAPAWAAGFLQRLPVTTPAERSRFADLLFLLDARDALPPGVDAGAVATAMLDDGQAAPLIAGWRAHGAAGTGDPQTGIVDGGFDRVAAGGGTVPPFGWTIPRRVAAAVAFATRGPRESDPVVTIESFGGGRQAALTQLLALAPGRYLLEFDARLDRGDPSDFAVELRCAGRRRAVPLRAVPAGADAEWTTQHHAFAVPPTDCAGQTLSILTDGGSDGIAAFDAFRLAPAR